MRTSTSNWMTMVNSQFFSSLLQVKMMLSIRGKFYLSMKIKYFIFFFIIVTRVSVSMFQCIKGLVYFLFLRLIAYIVQ